MFSGIQKPASTAPLTMKVSKESIEELATRSHVVKMFRQFDVNGDGVIDRNELGHVLTSTEKSWSPDRLDRLFRVVDMNQDGFIDYEEFLIWVFATPKVTTRDLRSFRDAAMRLSSANPSIRLSKEKKAEPRVPKVQARSHVINSTRLSRTLADKHCQETVAPKKIEPESIEPAKETLAVQETVEPEIIEATSEIIGSVAPPVVPAKLINVRVMSLTGNEIGTIDGIEITTTTGHNLKSTISATYGFPSFNMKLILASGDVINNSVLSTQACFCEVANSCGDDYLPVCCVLSTVQPLGPKEQGKRVRPFGSKAGMILGARISMSVAAARDNSSGGVSIFKVPDPSLREYAQRLVTESFAPHLAPLIDTGFNAACCAEATEATAEEVAVASDAFTYIDHEHSVNVDLSTCRLWTGMLEEATLAADSWVANMWKEDTSIYGFGNVVSAVLWRLISGWEGAAGAVRAGPVLEVLFLATHPAMREVGLATKLVKELEAGATAMGCSAVAVAAVPSQGISFWNRCGYEVAVPLGDNGPAEAVSALGEFLSENMLLFTDTPLVAKALA